MATVRDVADQVSRRKVVGPAVTACPFVGGNIHSAAIQRRSGPACKETALA
jgi:hypothetical protein